MTPAQERYLDELRRMPALEAEARVLIALFTDAAKRARAFGLGLDEDDFAHPGNRALFSAIRELVEFGADDVPFDDVVQVIATRGVALGVVERGRAAEQRIADVFATGDSYEVAFATAELQASMFESDIHRLRLIADARKAAA